MKNTKTQTTGRLGRVMRRLGRFGLMLGLAGVCCHAPAQTISPRVMTLANAVVVRTNVSATVNAATNLLASFNYQHDLAVWTIINSTNNVGTAYTVTNYFDLTPDGTTYTTGQPLTTIATVNGTNQVVSLTIIPKASLSGAAKIRLTSVGTGSTNWLSVTTQVSAFP